MSFIRKSDNFRNHQYRWQEMSKLWNEFSPPGRPSEDDIKNYDYFLNFNIIKIVLRFHSAIRRDNENCGLAQ